MPDGDNVVRLKFRNPPTVADDMMAFISCKVCRNKTYTLVDNPGSFALMRCAACGHHIGLIGWAESDETSQPPPAA